MVGSAIFMLLIGEAFKHLYGKANKDETEEERARRLTVEFVGNLAGGIPALSTIMETVTSGYDLESMEFSAINDILGTAKDAINIATDAALGNGGLGRLASCYLDSLTGNDLPATGFSIRYEFGIFKQKIEEGWQTELPDNWLPGGEVWLVPRTDRVFSVRLGGKIREEWRDGKLEILYEDTEDVEAVPYDMMISGGDSEAVNRLRLWKARDVRTFNLSLIHI